MIEFVWPWAFLLLPLPLLVYFKAPRVEQAQQTALKVPDLAAFDVVVNASQIKRNRKSMLLLAVLAWALLVAALARPQWIGEAIEMPTTGRNLMLAVDLSGSMKTPDFELRGHMVDRLTATKFVARQFIQRRQGDRLGLILFGERAYLQTPLTFDLQTVNTLLMESVIGLAGQKTAIGDAIGLAIKRLSKVAEDKRVLILLTDGANTAGEVSPIKAAQLAKEQHLKIYTIGLGAEEMVQQGFFGSQRINPSADLDEKTLRYIAESTGGRYFRARDTQELREIYKLLDQLEPADQDAQFIRPIQTLFYWPLSISFFCFVVIYIWRQRYAE